MQAVGFERVRVRITVAAYQHVAFLTARPALAILAAIFTRFHLDPYPLVKDALMLPPPPFLESHYVRLTPRKRFA